MYNTFVISKIIKNQFKSNETAYGEPQAFIGLTKGRSIEIVHESYGLELNETFYSLRLNCNEKEFDDGYYKNSVGIIEMANSDTFSDMLERVLLLIKLNDRINTGD